MRDLVKVLSGIPSPKDPRVVIQGGMEDVGAIEIGGGRALVQTIDFFPPIVDDPRAYGRIAAANALGDCYAAGATPLSALNVVHFPAKKLDLGILREILQGGAEKITEAGAVLLGGHSVDDDEQIFYGLAVTGEAPRDRLVSQRGAQPGHAVVLTKPLGMGAAATALKAGKAGGGRGAGATGQGKVAGDLLQRIVAIMGRLNRRASEAMVRLGAAAATDVTGFGLAGHATNLARASEVSIVFDTRALPILPEAEDFARRGLLSGGCERVKAWLGERVRVAPTVAAPLRDLCHDAETSGGLLIAISPERAGDLVTALEEEAPGEARVVGEVVARQDAWDLRLA